MASSSRCSEVRSLSINSHKRSADLDRHYPEVERDILNLQLEELIFFGIMTTIPIPEP